MAISNGRAAAALPVLLVLFALWQRMGVPNVSRSETRSLSMIQLKPELQKTTLDAEQTFYVPAFEQRRMPGVVPAASSSGCPHEEADLIPFEDFLEGKDPAGNLILSSGRYLLSTSLTVGSLTISEQAELVLGENLELQTRAIWVKGVLRLGSDSCRLQNLVITFTGDGDKDARSSNALETKGLVVSGELHAFGHRFRPTWTRLAQAAAAGSSTLQLMEEVDWQVGQQLVVVTTAWTDDPEDHQNELRSISAVSGAQITLSAPLDFDHYGGPEYFAEVALLSRSVTFQGDASSEASRYGGHVMCVPGILSIST